MDPLSIAASIAGVATAGVTISIALYDVAHALKSAPKGIVSLAQELSLLSSILRSLQSTIRGHPKICKKRLVDDTNQILSGVRTVHKDIKDMMLDSTSNFYRLKLAFKSPKTKSIMAKVESYKSTLNLILGTVQLAVLKSQNKKTQDPSVATEVAQLRALLQSLMMSNLESVDKLKESERKAIVNEPPTSNFPPRASDKLGGTTPPPPPYDGHPTYIRIRREFLEPETLSYYGVRYSIDPNDEAYFLLLEYLETTETDVLFEHTRRLRRERDMSKNGKNNPPAQHDIDRPTMARREEARGDNKKASINMASRNDRHAGGNSSSPNASSGSTNDADKPTPSDTLGSEALNRNNQKPAPIRERSMAVDLSPQKSINRHGQDIESSNNADWRSNNQPLSKWEAAKEDTATWLYRLVFHNYDAAPDAKDSTAVVKQVPPSYVDNLVLQWTDVPATNETESPDTSGDGEDTEWQQKLDVNTARLTIDSSQHLNTFEMTVESEGESDTDRVRIRDRRRSRQRDRTHVDEGPMHESGLRNYFGDDESPYARLQRAERHMREMEEKYKRDLEISERKHEEELLKMRYLEKNKVEENLKQEAEAAMRKEILAQQIRILGSKPESWDTASVTADTNMPMTFAPKVDDLSRQHGVRGTLLWTSSRLPSTSEMYDQLTGRGWKPLWARINGLGETWFLGSQPVQVMFYHKDYKPQVKNLTSAGEFVAPKAQTGDVVAVSEDLIEPEALTLLGMEALDRRNGRYHFRPDLTSHDVENLIATSMLIREHQLRAKARAMIENTSVTRRQPPPQSATVNEVLDDDDREERRRRRHRTARSTSDDLLSPPSDVHRHRRSGGSRGSASDLSGNESRSSARSSRRDGDRQDDTSRRRRKDA